MKDDKKDKLWTKTNLVLVISALLGMLLIVIAVPLSTRVLWLSALVEGLGIAAITATILGFAVDKVLKRELTTEAVKAAIGYLLPDELKAEMQWITEFDFFAIEHIATYQLKMDPTDNTIVILHAELRRRFKNITDAKKPISIGFSCDEWGVPSKPSKILRVAYRMDDEKWTSIDTTKFKLDEGALLVSGSPMNVPSKSELDVESIWEETKHLNDENDIGFGYPTLNPRVIVTTDPKLKWRVAFGHRGQEWIEPNPEGGGCRLNGTLLPQQRIILRWWPK